MFASGQDSKGPSVAEIQRFIREQTIVEFLLSNGERLAGKLRWFDDHAFSIQANGDEQITILRSAVLAYKVASKQ